MFVLGSGKTFTICARIVWLISNKGIKPENILGLTLSNKAINEMRDRLSGIHQLFLVLLFKFRVQIRLALI